MAFLINESEAITAATWNDFLSVCPAATYCHRYEWKPIIEAAYGLTVKQLLIDFEGQLVGAFPLVLTPGLGGRAVSMAYCNYGDVAAAEGWQDYVPDMRSACLEYLARNGVKKVEVRSKIEKSGEAREVTLILGLPATSDELWRNIGDKARNQVRKAKRSGLVTQWGSEQVDDLYAVYAANMGRLGTPVHARTFFERAVSEFGDDADVLTVRLEGKVVGAMMLIKHNNTWADPFASSLPGYQQYNPNMMLYWEALRSASLHGARFFDFGRSQVGSGTAKFKSQWGAIAYPLEYRTFIGGVAHDIALTGLYRGRMGKVVSRVWSRLPATVQLVLGPAFRRHVP